jgi:DNA-damage-inducible protein J
MPAKSDSKPSSRKPSSRPAAKRRAATPAKVAGRKPAKTGYINARVEPKLKKSAEAVLDKLGLSTTDAVTIFLKQVVAQKGLPFAVKVPNRETVRALRDAEAGRTERFTGSTEELFASILGKRPR